MPPKVKLAIDIVEDYGWVQEKPKPGSHRQFEHPTKPGKVTIPGHWRDTLSMKTWKSIVEQAAIPRWLIRGYNRWRKGRRKR